MSAYVECPKCGIEKIPPTCSQCSACEVAERYEEKLDAARANEAALLAEREECLDALGVLPTASLYDAVRTVVEEAEQHEQWRLAADANIQALRAERDALARRVEGLEAALREAAEAFRVAHFDGPAVKVLAALRPEKETP